MTATRPGKALAEELQAERHSATLHPTLARLIEAVASHTLTEALYFRLLGQSSAHLSISTTGLRERLTHVPERQPAWNPVRFWRQGCYTRNRLQAV